MSCPCGVGDTYETCCQPVHDGSKPAATAEALMRARYSAFAKGNVDFIVESTIESEREHVDREAVQTWSKGSEWHGIDILGTEDGGPDDDRGVVEFVAHYSVQGQEIPHQEVAAFEKVDGRWYFVDGQVVNNQPFRRTQQKIGNNDPCPCGSGKKWKKCHKQTGLPPELAKG
jgi:SEC-C motif-containing protein